MRRVLLTLIVVLTASVAVSAQQAGRPRKVATKPAEPCNARDFVAADDTGFWWACNPLTLLWDRATSSGTPITGSGTANTLPKFTAACAVGNSGISDTAATIIAKLTETAPTAASVALAGAGAGNVSNGAHTVKVTCVTAAGETTAGTASGTVTVTDKTVDGKVAITNIPLCSALATGRNVYMATVAAPTVYKLLSNGVIANNTATTLTANDSDATLAASTTAPTTNTAIDARLTVGQSTIANAENATIAGTLSVTGHATVEGVTSTGATGTGKFVFDTSPTLATPIVGVAAGTSLALGGATIGSDALGVTGTSTFSDVMQIAEAKTFRWKTRGTEPLSRAWGFTNDLVTYGTMRLQSSSGDNNTLNTNMQVWDSAGNVFMPGLASSSAATTGTVCWTTSTGLLNVDTTTSCLASSIKYKERVRPLRSGLDTVLKLRPVSYFLKVDPAHIGEQEGLIAEDVAKVDARLVSTEKDGSPHAVRYQQLTATLVLALQELNQKFETYKAVTDAKLATQARTIRRLRHR